MRKKSILAAISAVCEFATKSLLVVMMVAALTCVACSEDKADEPETSTIEGVVMPAKPLRTCGANGANVKVTVKTLAAYKLDVDNSEMITIRTNASGSQAGTYSVDLQVSRNESGEERRGVVYITVEGYSRIKLLEIVQSVGSTDAVVNWVDERLQNEYYWLDEYKEKLATFDYSLAYDKFLSTSLLSLSTNIQDGGVDGNSRYLYSNITRKAKKSSASSYTRAEDERKTTGFGILLSSYNWGWTQSTLAFAVEHVYPSSPAANAGLKRGDVITHVNGNTIPMTSDRVTELKREIVYNQGTTLTIEGETFDKEKNDYVPFKYTLTAADYEENPVAYSAVLTFDEETQKQVDPDHTKKIGHLVYLSFESDFDQELITAIEELAAQGITDLILDLRSNGGGSVNSSIMLGSMILPESYIGKTYATLVRNPRNTRIGENDECLIVRNGLGDMSKKDLPNLNLEKLWVITSPSTASASEMVIKGLEGLDVEVVMVGKTTEGKNCGMDVEERTFDSFVYTYSPITFMNQNAKGDSDYADGIKPDVNFDDYVATDTANENDMERACRVFPIPQVEWWDMQRDFATYEAALRVCGYTLIPKDEGTGENTSDAVSASFKPIGSTVTRAAGRSYTVFKGETLPAKSQGATLTEREREDLILSREK